MLSPDDRALLVETAGSAAAKQARKPVPQACESHVQYYGTYSIGTRAGTTKVPPSS